MDRCFNQNLGKSFKIELVDGNGLRNQQGRKIIARPRKNPAFTITRFVDSGSGYMNQNQYPVLVGTPFDDEHIVDVYFANKVVTFPIKPGEWKKVFATGKIETIEFACRK